MAAAYICFPDNIFAGSPPMNGLLNVKAMPMDSSQKPLKPG
jgi:hypothetical protein